MSDINGLPYVTISFDRAGKRISPPPIRPTGISDLIVISHGWHQNAEGPGGADSMYRELLGNVVTQAKGFGEKSFGVTGVFWPSDEFNDDLTFQTAPDHGGAAAVEAGHDLDPARLRARAAQVAALLEIAPADLVAKAEAARAGGANAATALLATLRDHLSFTRADDETKAEHARLFSEDPVKLLTQLKTPPPLPAAPAEGGDAAVGDGGVGGFIHGVYSGITSAIAQVLNQAAYFELKTRAGVIGQALARELDADGLNGVRLHLIGHSFGARLVTACAASLAHPVQSMSLLQGAFSHNAFGTGVGPNKADGAFRSVVTGSKVTGPIAVTHTWNDQAVGFIYAVASRASNDYARAVMTQPWLGGAQDIYGGLGANGALHITEPPTAPNEGKHVEYDGQATPALDLGKINSLHCDFIKEHSDVRQPKVARIVLAAIS